MAKPFKGKVRFRVDGQSREVRLNERGEFFITDDFKNLENITFETTKGAPIDKVQTYPSIFTYNHPSYIVISDMDDTILISRSTKFLSKLWLMLFRQTSKRNFVEESEKAYRKLKDKEIPFFYVSASEQNLFATISNFLEFHELPIGPIFLRPYSTWKQMVGEKSREDFKVKRIERIMSIFPQVKIALFGDDSQNDPAVFKALSHKYPERIDRVFIRNTGASKNLDLISTMKKTEAEMAEVFHYSKFEEIESAINQIIDENTSGS